MRLIVTKIHASNKIVIIHFTIIYADDRQVKYWTRLLQLKNGSFFFDDSIYLIDLKKQNVCNFYLNDYAPRRFVDPFFHFNKSNSEKVYSLIKTDEKFISFCSELNLNRSKFNIPSKKLSKREYKFIRLLLIAKKRKEKIGLIGEDVNYYIPKHVLIAGATLSTNFSRMLYWSKANTRSYLEKRLFLMTENIEAVKRESFFFCKICVNTKKPYFQDGELCIFNLGHDIVFYDELMNNDKISSILLNCHANEQKKKKIIQQVFSKDNIFEECRLDYVIPLYYSFIQGADLYDDEDEKEVFEFIKNCEYKDFPIKTRPTRGINNTQWLKNVNIILKKGNHYSHDKKNK